MEAKYHLCISSVILLNMVRVVQAIIPSPFFIWGHARWQRAPAIFSKGVVTDCFFCWSPPFVWGLWVQNQDSVMMWLCCLVLALLLCWLGFITLLGGIGYAGSAGWGGSAGSACSAGQADSAYWAGSVCLLKLALMAGLALQAELALLVGLALLAGLVLLARWLDWICWLVLALLLEANK